MSRVPDEVELIFASVLILLNKYSPEDVADLDLSWRTAGRRLCSDVNRLRSNLLDIHSSEIPSTSLNEIRVLFEASDVNLPQPTTVSTENAPDEVAGNEIFSRIPSQQNGSILQDPQGIGTTDILKNSQKQSQSNAFAETEADTETQAQVMGTSPSRRSVATEPGETRSAGRISSLSPVGNHNNASHNQDPEAYTILLQWLADAVSLHEHLNQVARPLEREYNDFVAEIDRRELGLDDMRRSCNAISDRISSLQQSFDTSTRVKNEHRNALEEITRELKQAQAFLETLQDEQTSWHTSLVELQEEASYVEANALMSAAIRTYLPGLSYKTRTHLISVWVESILDKGLHISSEVQISRRASILKRISSPNRRRVSTSSSRPKTDITSTPSTSATEAEQEMQMLDIDSILPYLCDKTAVIQGAQQGDDEFFFINRAVVAWPVSWQLVLDPHGFGAEHIVRIETNSVISSSCEDSSKSRNSFTAHHGVDGEQSNQQPVENGMVIVDLKFGCIEWSKLQLQLEDAFASQVPVLLLNAPEELDPNLHNYLLSMWQRLSRMLLQQQTGGRSNLHQTGYPSFVKSSSPSNPTNREPLVDASTDVIASNSSVNMRDLALEATQDFESNSLQQLPEQVTSPPFADETHNSARNTAEEQQAVAMTTSRAHPEATLTSRDSAVHSRGIFWNSRIQTTEQQLSYDVTGHIVPRKLPVRVYICGPRLNLDSWLGTGQSYLSLISYADVSLLSMQQFVGAMLYKQFWRVDNLRHTQLISQASRLEEAIVAARRQLVDALSASDGLPDAVGISEVVRTKQEMDQQLEETQSVLEELDVSQGRCDVISSYCCRLVQVALSLNCLSSTYSFTTSMVVRYFTRALEDNARLDIDHEMHELPTIGPILDTARLIRAALSEHHTPAFDILFYFHCYVPMLSQQQDIVFAEKNHQHASNPADHGTCTFDGHGDISNHDEERQSYRSEDSVDGAKRQISSIESQDAKSKTLNEETTVGSHGPTFANDSRGSLQFCPLEDSELSYLFTSLAALAKSDHVGPVHSFSSSSKWLQDAQVRLYLDYLN